jgi:hypothetical protein
LNGSLDDLSIQDVLQILSLGRKTGCLSLETPAGGGAIVFRKGRVVASYDGGDPLRSTSVVPLSAAERDRLIRERTTDFVHRLTRCPRGQFRFELASQSPWAAAAGRELSSGIDVVKLLIDVASRQDDREGEGSPSDAETPIRLVGRDEPVPSL